MTHPTATVGWLTFHRWAFEAQHENGLLPIPAPAGARHWQFGPDSPLDADGVRSGVGTSWAAVGFFVNRVEAEAALDGAASIFAALPAHRESVHVLLRPVRFSGECNWLTEAGLALAPAEVDPGGVPAVLTSAGYDEVGPAQLPRMRDFRENVDRVRAWYDGIDDNIVNGNYSTGRDGMTFSLWRGDAGLTRAAYGQGAHRTQLDRQRRERMADRTSYTRARVVRHIGTWDGVDPVAKAAAAA